MRYYLHFAGRADADRRRAVDFSDDFIAIPVEAGLRTLARAQTARASIFHGIDTASASYDLGKIEEMAGAGLMAERRFESRLDAARCLRQRPMARTRYLTARLSVSAAASAEGR